MYIDMNSQPINKTKIKKMNIGIHAQNLKKLDVSEIAHHGLKSSCETN